MDSSAHSNHSAQNINLRLSSALKKRLKPTEQTSQTLELLSFIPSVSPNLEPPEHLKPLIDLFERVARGETVRALVSTPPQHGKSLACLHALVWLLKKLPTKRHAYATYAQQFSRDQSFIAKQIAERSSLALNRDTADRWNTSQGGGVVWTSRGGPLTGHPIDGVLLIDDLLKDREEANSNLIREKAMGWLSSVAMTRMHPGASVIFIATRWHLDDPHGRLKDDWEYIPLPAIKADNTALWESQRPLEWLVQQKQNLLPNDWSALYMCEPIADGSRVFQGVSYYDTLPDAPYREAHGFDAAYSSKTSSDYTVTISGRLIDGKIYVTNLLRSQQEPMHYIPMMKLNGVTKVTWFRSGTEKGLEQFLQRESIEVNAITASTDKLTRAMPAATAWNRGEILLSKSATFTPIIESEISSFTGFDDAHDDIVDALAALVASMDIAQPRIRRLT